MKLKFLLTWLARIYRKKLNAAFTHTILARLLSLLLSFHHDKYSRRTLGTYWKRTTAFRNFLLFKNFEPLISENIIGTST